MRVNLEPISSKRHVTALGVTLTTCLKNSVIFLSILLTTRRTFRGRSTNCGKRSDELTRRHRWMMAGTTTGPAAPNSTLRTDKTQITHQKIVEESCDRHSKHPSRGVNRSRVTAVTNIEVKCFYSPDINNVLPNDLSEAAVVEFGDVKVTRMRIKPGWRWSEHIKPMVGTGFCQVRHLGVVTKGRVRVSHDDGTESTDGAGDAYSVMPGHDAWVEGDETVEGFAFAGTWADKF